MGCAEVSSQRTSRARSRSKCEEESGSGAGADAGAAPNTGHGGESWALQRRTSARHSRETRSSGSGVYLRGEDGYSGEKGDEDEDECEVGQEEKSVSWSLTIRGMREA